MVVSLLVARGSSVPYFPYRTMYYLLLPTCCAAGRVQFGVFLSVMFTLKR